MRLKQLAKEINVTAGLIETFLLEKGEVKEINPNSKLDEAAIISIKKHFKISDKAPVENETKESSENTSEEKETPTSLISKEDAFPNLRKVTTEKKAIVEKEQALKTELDENGDPKILSFEERMQIEVPNVDDVPDEDVIKAPKVELEGFKVVDKIDLPEPKVVEVETEEGETTEANTEEDPEKPKKKKKSGFPKRRGPSLTEQKAREEKQYQEELKEKQKKEKEAKKQHYIENVLEKKTKVVPKKKKSKAAEVAVEAKSQKEEAPKSLVGKFLRWLND